MDSNLMAGTPEEATLAATIFSLEEVRDAAHQWLEDMLEQLEEQGRLAATASVVLTPEGQEGGSEVGMVLSISFVPMMGGAPVLQPLSVKGVVH